ncbi:MAG: hypothetical protein A3J60_03765 [Candidatus Pacebacteria bacterium RIFCSPHIGHO2_02_FULL_46_9]|nr:MAG: hypothetical protein A3J60_03765 [Candidatus Pacebacteria bacterium RIFCSPHIGHO2_02_FULL_46_9]
MAALVSPKHSVQVRILVALLEFIYNNAPANYIYMFFPDMKMILSMNRCQERKTKQLWRREECTLRN